MTQSQDPPQLSTSALSRRAFLKGAGGVAAAGGALSQAADAESTRDPRVLEGELSIELRINGSLRKVQVEPRTTLLALLRHGLEPALTGTKEVCDRGNCGACTVIVDGRTRYACMQLAVDLVGTEIRTIESLGSPQQLSPVQEAFCKHDASMCGYCTSGFVVATTSLLERNPKADLDEIKHGLSGNICRCGTYPHIFSAALEAGGQMGGK
ncbi:MAG: xanthine dehydrogenase YagT iron-sulfur-binding subunit [Planctomycetota bacterium]|jgi:xanthine dehydrogenase YagT iron-sulfur-binding subunit